MSTIPTYLSATVGQPGIAGQVNQFLGAHNATLVYSGAALTSSQTTGSAVYAGTQSQYLSQSFTTGSSQTTISQVWLQVSVVGGSPITATTGPLQLSVYADSGGFPTGNALATTSFGETFIYSSGFWTVFLLPLTGLTPSTSYHLVTNPVGNATSYYVWQQSNQTGGVATSPDNVVWTSQPYGLMYQVYDQTSTGLITYVVEDSGARWASYTYNAQNLPATATEYTVDQTGNSYLYSTRALTYTSGLITGVT